jgi:16S rRNA (adenine(1408)-N(1))-methyltransferase
MANLLYLQAAIERLPPELSGQADRITVNFPWGSLLRAVAAPEPALLGAIASLGRPGAALTLLVNLATFDGAGYCAKLALPCPPVFASESRTRAAYEEAGLRVKCFDSDAKDLPYRTTWGQRLTKGTQRRVLHLEARVVGSPPTPPLPLSPASRKRGLSARSRSFAPLSREAGREGGKVGR